MENTILYTGTVDGVDFQQGLPDLDTLDLRDKHLIILDDLMDETDQRGGFAVYEKESPQKHQRHVHRSESVSSRKTP